MIKNKVTSATSVSPFPYFVEESLLEILLFRRADLLHLFRGDRDLVSRQLNILLDPKPLLYLVCDLLH